MVLILFRVQNVAKRLDPRRINAMRFVHKIKPDSSASRAAMVSLDAAQLKFRLK
jgi:hypothetical protein